MDGKDRRFQVIIQVSCSIYGSAYLLDIVKTRSAKEVYRRSKTLGNGMEDNRRLYNGRCLGLRQILISQPAISSRPN